MPSEQLLEHITRSLDMLVSEHTQPDVEFKLLIKVTMLSEGLTSGDVIGTSALARDRTLDPALASKPGLLYVVFFTPVWRSGDCMGTLGFLSFLQLKWLVGFQTVQ